VTTNDLSGNRHRRAIFFLAEKIADWASKAIGDDRKPGASGI